MVETEDKVEEKIGAAISAFAGTTRRNAGVWSGRKWWRVGFEFMTLLNERG
jgi:hypothetical protein